MTQKILEEFKQRITCLQLQPFDDGRFEVFLDGRKIFSKLAAHRFPEYSEIRTALAKKRRAKSAAVELPDLCRGAPSG